MLKLSSAAAWRVNARGEGGGGQDVGETERQGKGTVKEACGQGKEEAGRRGRNIIEVAGDMRG